MAEMADAGAGCAGEAPPIEISEQEAAIYDRQIRLWGVEAQRRMRSSRILFCGFGTLNAEICKNLVLSGVNVTLQDSSTVAHVDLGGNFFLRSEDVGANRAEAGAVRIRELNPLVEVQTLTKEASALTLEDLTNSGVSCVCAANLSIADQHHINALCRAGGVPFFSCTSCGFNAFMFCDLGAEHTVLIKELTQEENADGERLARYAPKTVRYCTLSEALGVGLDEIGVALRPRRRSKAARHNTMFATEALFALHVVRHLGGKSEVSEQEAKEALEALAAGAGLSGEALAALVDPRGVVETAVAAAAHVEISPVCAVVGGIVGQELIKAISGKDDPVNNFFFFEGLSGSGLIRRVAPKSESAQ